MNDLLEQTKSAEKALQVAALEYGMEQTKEYFEKVRSASVSYREAYLKCPLPSSKKSEGRMLHIYTMGFAFTNGPGFETALKSACIEYYERGSAFEIQQLLAAAAS